MLLAMPAHASYKVGEGDLSVKGSVFGVYDDNVTYSKSNEIDDFITELTAGADWVLESKLHSVVISGTVSEDIYLDNDDFTNTSGVITAVYKADLSKYDHFSLANRFSYEEQPSSFDDEFENDRGRFGYYRNRTDVDYTHDWTEQFLTHASYMHQFNDITRAGSQDSSSHEASFEGEYAVSSRWSWIGGYGFRFRDFYDGGQDSHAHSAIAGFRYKMNELWTAEFRESVDFIESFDGEELTRPSTRATLIYASDDRGDFRLTFNQRYDTTTFSTASLFEQWRISADWRRELSRRWKVKAGFFYGEGEYRGTTREEETLGLNGQLSYDLSVSWRAIVAYTFSSTDSTSNTTGYEKNRITVGLTYDFA